jgi:hypothetical protein
MAAPRAALHLRPQAKGGLRHAHHLGARSVLGIVCAATLTACGSSGQPAGRNAGPAGLKAAQCMRSHGVPNFPDPGGTFPPGIKQAPAFRSAMQACNRLQPDGTSTGKPLTESQRTAALAQVRCLRDHGMPTIPDPTFPSSGGELFPAIPGFDSESPEFRHAAAACGLRGPVGQPHGG